MLVRPTISAIFFVRCLFRQTPSTSLFDSVTRFCGSDSQTEPNHGRLQPLFLKLFFVMSITKSWDTKVWSMTDENLASVEISQIHPSFFIRTEWQYPHKDANI